INSFFRHYVTIKFPEFPLLFQTIDLSIAVGVGAYHYRIITVYERLSDNEKAGTPAGSRTGFWTIVLKDDGDVILWLKAKEIKQYEDANVLLLVGAAIAWQARHSILPPARGRVGKSEN